MPVSLFSKKLVPEGTNFGGSIFTMTVVLLQWCQFVGIQYLVKGACRVTVMNVGDRGGIAPMSYILWPPLRSAAYGLNNADAGRPLAQDCSSPLIDSPTGHYTNTGTHSS